MSTPLQLDHYVIELLEIAADLGYSPDAEETRIDVRLTPEVLTNKSDTHMHQVVLDISVAAPEGLRVPYAVRVKGRGFFRVEGEVAREEEAGLVLSNGSAILLGLLRAQVAQVTAMGPHGTFLLPPINLIDAFKDSWESKAASCSESDSLVPDVEVDGE